MPNYVLINARQTGKAAKKFNNVKDHKATGDSPTQAAAKITTAVCKTKKIRGRCALKLVIRQTGTDKTFKYQTKRELILPKDRVKTGIQKADGSPLTFKYKPVVKRIFDSKPRSAPTPTRTKEKSSTPTKKKASKKTPKSFLSMIF